MRQLNHGEIRPLPPAPTVQLWSSANRFLGAMDGAIHLDRRLKGNQVCSTDILFLFNTFAVTACQMHCPDRQGMLHRSLWVRSTIFFSEHDRHDYADPQLPVCICSDHLHQCDVAFVGPMASTTVPSKGWRCSHRITESAINFRFRQPNVERHIISSWVGTVSR